MKIVSACLAGMACKRNGTAIPCDKVIELLKKGDAIPVCPEQLGGLSTPRLSAEIQKNGQVKTKTGTDVSEFFFRGAQQVVELAKTLGCKEAILKSRSPSCGCGKIYDGNFSGTLIDGDGICTKLLKENGINVITEDDL